MKIVSIINNKGGVGKTTLVQNLSVGLARKGFKVGLIDFDPQANLSSVFGHEPKATLREILSEGKKITTASFSPTYQHNLFIIPNLKDISVKMFGFLSFQDEKTILKDRLGKIDFDFLFIDTPPNLELQTINSMIASDFILIPVKYDIFSLQGIVTVKEYFEKTKQSINQKLEILGIVATNVDERESMNSPIRAKLESIFGDKYLKSSIKVNTKFKHAQIQRQDVYAIGDLKAISDFESLISEILPKLRK